MSDPSEGYTGLLDWIASTGLRRIAWTTDLDSTLLDPQKDPNAAFTPPGLADACRDLDKKTGGGFFIITGRDLGYVDHQVFPGDWFAASTEYHNRVRYERGSPAQDLSPIPSWNVIDADLDCLAGANPKLVLRKKPFMRSLHYSQVPEADRAAVKAELSETLTGLLSRLNQESGQHLKLTDGGLIFDMGPAGPDKGQALQDYTDHLNRRDGIARLPIYFGDSPGDLPGALKARELGGVFVAVGDHPKVSATANFMLKDTAECRALFEAASRLPVVPTHTPRNTLDGHSL